MEDSVPIERRLTAPKGLIGLLAATAATFVFATLSWRASSPRSATTTPTTTRFQFIATFGGDAGARAQRVLHDRGPRAPDACHLRVPALPSVGLSAGCWSRSSPTSRWPASTRCWSTRPTEDLPDQLARTRAAAGGDYGLFVDRGRPLVEEFFFRGFLFQALRNSWGTRWARSGSAAIFGGDPLRAGQVRAAVLSSVSRSRCCSSRPLDLAMHHAARAQQLARVRRVVLGGEGLRHAARARRHARRRRVVRARCRSAAWRRRRQSGVPHRWPAGPARRLLQRRVQHRERDLLQDVTHTDHRGPRVHRRRWAGHGRRRRDRPGGGEAVLARRLAARPAIALGSNGSAPNACSR